MKVLDKIKVLDILVGINNYYREQNNVRTYLSKKEIEESIVKIPQEYLKTLSKYEYVFLSKQNEELIEKIKESIDRNKSLYEDYFYGRGSNNWIKFLDETEIKLFNIALNTRYRDSVDGFIELLRKECPFNDIKKILKVATEYRFGPSSYGERARRLTAHQIRNILFNESIINLEESDIATLILNCNYVLEDIPNDLSEKDLAILLNPNAKFLSEVDESQLELVNNFASMMTEESMNSLFKVKYNIFNFKEELNNMLDNIRTFIVDDVQRTYTINALIEAIESEYIFDANDYNLISNKIRYGSVYNNERAIAYDILGVKYDDDDNEDMYIQWEKLGPLLKLKRHVSKSLFRRFINNKEIRDCFDGSIVYNVIAISKVIELGQLNDSKIIELMRDCYRHPRMMGDTTDKLNGLSFKLSPEEFFYCVQNNSYIDVEDIESLKSMKHALRLVKIKEKVELNSILNNSNFCVNNNEFYSFFKDKDIKSLMKKENPLKIKDIKDYLEYLYLSSYFNIDNMESFNKIRFLLSYYSMNDIKNMNISDIDEKIWSSYKMNSLLNILNLSDEFKSSYKNELIEFCLSEKSHLVSSYYDNYRVGETQKKGISLIAKSIIANKYEDLKFVKEDIKKEISMDISDEAFDAWKRTDVLTKGEYKVEDSSDFEKIMRMGDIPVRSCMNYINGMYSHCLLSNFDTSKKMLVIHKNGKYVGRAILRLTVMSDEYVDYVEDTNNTLDFIDVDNAKDKTSSKSDVDKKVIIFLEKAYTTLDTKDLKECYSMIVELLNEKAKEMNATLVVSKTYYEYVGTDCKSENKYVFITASKNGAQYLDSFDGSTSSSYCYKQGNVYIY